MTDRPSIISIWPHHSAIDMDAGLDAKSQKSHFERLMTLKVIQDHPKWHDSDLYHIFMQTTPIGNIVFSIRKETYADRQQAILLTSGKI